MIITDEMRQKAQRRLARLKGYENIAPYGQGGYLIGTMKNHTGDIIIPAWVDDWQACGALWSAHRPSIGFDKLRGAVEAEGVGVPIPMTAASNAGAVLRYAIVIACIKLLEKEPHE